MPILIATKNGEQTYPDRNVLVIGNQPNCNIKIDFPTPIILTFEIQPNKSYKVINSLGSKNLFFKGQPMGTEILVERACKLMTKNQEDFIGIKLLHKYRADRSRDQQAPAPTPEAPSHPSPQQDPSGLVVAQQRINRKPSHPKITMDSIAAEDFDENDIRELYGENINAATKIKLTRKKSDIEARRVAIFKEIAFAIDDAKKKIKANSYAEKFLLVALIACPIIMASAISDAIRDVVTSAPRSVFPLYMRLLLGYAILLFVNSLILKQGIFLYIQERIQEKIGFKEKEAINAQSQKAGKVAKSFMLALSSAIFVVIGLIILIFYLNPESTLEQGPTMISLIALFALILCSVCSGYFKSTSTEAEIQLDKYENREDIKNIMQEYQGWIALFINNLSSVKLKNTMNKQFILKLKAVGEICLGIATSPFLAFGVSNTLAMCFPEAAGWIRISGLRLSPVFLVLSTFMIIFAFFSLTNAFVTTKQINGSEVIKKDGFENYMHHGVVILGTEGIKKAKFDGVKSFLIALCILIIEFTMNVSYFMQEIGGGEWSGIFLSFVAALVPTALLVAETYMLSHTQYEAGICDEILSRLDKEIE